jgi:hypothetical protein
MKSHKMKLRVYGLVLVFVLATSIGVRSLASYPECSFKVEVDQMDAREGKKGQFKLLPSGGKSPYKFVVYKSSGHLVSEDFDKSEFNGMNPGTYHVIVVDEKGCKNQLEIQLK